MQPPTSKAFPQLGKLFHPLANIFILNRLRHVSKVVPAYPGQGACSPLPHPKASNDELRRCPPRLGP